MTPEMIEDLRKYHGVETRRDPLTEMFLLSHGWTTASPGCWVKYGHAVPTELAVFMERVYFGEEYELV